jgi:hypothetical protein
MLAGAQQAPVGGVATVSVHAYEDACGGGAT